MATRAKIETLGEKGNCVKVKRMKAVFGGFVWIAGGVVTSDNGKLQTKMPCGKGGIIRQTRQEAILQFIHEILQSIPEDGWKTARKVLNDIFEKQLKG